MASTVYPEWGGSGVQRIKLDVMTGGQVVKSFKFAVNPQNYKETHAVRTFLQQTRTANTVQRFGEGPAEITISGHFGDRANGYTNSMLLRNELKTYLEMFSDNNYSDSAMAFRNYTLNDYWFVEPAPNGFSFSIDANQPTIINYQITFYVVADMTQALPADRTDTTLGNDKVNSTPAYVTANSSSQEAINSASEHLNNQDKKNTKKPKKPKKKTKKKKKKDGGMWGKPGKYKPTKKKHGGTWGKPGKRNKKSKKDGGMWGVPGNVKIPK